MKRQLNTIFEAIIESLTPKGWKLRASSGEYFYIYKSPIVLKKGDSCIFKTSRKTLKNGHVFKKFLIVKK